MSAPRWDTIPGTAQLLRVTPGTVRRWIREGKLTTRVENGVTVIPNDVQANNTFFLGKLKARMYTPQKPWVSERIKGYSKWHDLLDEFAWLIKASYASKDQLKRRFFRADILFVSYLRAHAITLQKIKRTFSSNPDPNRPLITSDLKRGWYNETAFLFPLKRSTLGHSFADIELNKEVSEVRFAFPSWRIITAYYAVYFYLRAVTLHLHDTFRLEEHGSTLASFKYSVLSPLKQSVWRFPFDIAYDPRSKMYRSKLYISQIDYLKYAYARYPRQPHPTAYQLFERIYAVFKKRGQQRKKPLVYTIFDYLHDFRIWSNYLDIDNLLSLKGQGYKAFLDQNLSLILFFIAGISELCFIAVFGSKRYVAELQKFYDEFVTNSPELEEEFVKTSLFQRLRIYNELGFVPENIRLRRKFDINAVFTEEVSSSP